MVVTTAARVVGASAIALAMHAGPAAAIETERFGVEPYPLIVEGGARRGFEVSLASGGSESDSVRLWNKTEEPVVVRLYGAGVEIEGDRYEVAAYEARSEGTGAWLVPERSEVRLGPGEEAIVGFTVRAPLVLPEDGRTAALVAESDTGVETGGVDVVARLAMLVRIAPGGGGLGGIPWLVWLALGLAAAAGAGQLVARRARRARPA